MSSTLVWRRRDPFADFEQTFNTLMRRAFSPTAAPGAGTFVPAADLARDGDDAIVKLELPGLDVEKDVTVEIENGRLTVKGERRSERDEESEGRRYHEVRYGNFQRSFGLPEHITAEAVSASYDAGVLSVRVAGAYATPEPTAQRIAVIAGTPELSAAESAESAASAESAESAEPAESAESAERGEQPAA